MNKLHFPLFACVSLACALLVGCSRSDSASSTDGQSELQVRWHVGKAYEMQAELKQTSESDVPNLEQPVKQDMNVTQDYTISVLSELPDGGRELELEFTGVKMEMGNGMLLTFDSSKDASQDAGNPLASVLRKLVGARLQYVTDSEGKVVEVKGYQEFVERISAGGNPQMQAMLSGMYNEGSMKQYADLCKMAPGRGVKPGDTWNVNVQEEMGPAGIMVIDAELSFKDWEQRGDRKCARIESTGSIISKPSETATGADSPLSVEVEQGEVTATEWFDPELGMLVESVADQTLTMKVSMMGQVLPSRAKQTVTFKLLDVKDAER